MADGARERQGADGLSAPGRDADAEAVRAAVRGVWERHRSTVLAQLEVLAAAADALRRGELGAAERAEARAVAHRLAGSLGTFGLDAASERAREAELLLHGSRPIARAHGELLAAAASAIAREARAPQPEAPTEPSCAAPPLAAAGAPLALIVEHDAARGEELAVALVRRGARAEIARSPQAARASVAARRPDAVLLDLAFPGGTDEAYALLAQLTGARPPVPVLLATPRDELPDRVEVARHGGRHVVARTLAPGEIAGRLLGLVARVDAPEIRVLAVDDDPALLDAVAALLRAEGHRVVTLADPSAFWHELERTEPDLVLLDIEMPGLDGLELCRVMRADPRWATVPVLIVTARRDAATIERIFEAGADDHLAKPLLAGELRVRVRNRVDRLRLHRALAETDELTGVANRPTARHGLERLVRLAARHEQPFALVLLDLDRFKAVNDEHGHAAGDEVLRRLGALMRRSVRGEDIVGRWGGEELVIGMYGIGHADASQRTNALLAALRAERFAGRDGELFDVAFSAGIAVRPRDGADLDALLAAADAALYRAKDAGRSRVEPAGGSR